MTTRCTYDQDGRLLVGDAVLSRACTSPYLGSEIADWKNLGLRPNALYTLLRSPREIARALSTFANLPVTRGHLAFDGTMPASQVIGRVLGNIAFDGDQLTGDLMIWDRAAIDAIERGTQADLSLAYHFRPELKPGRWHGKRVHGVMRDLCGGHLAVVTQGRTPGCTLAGARIGH
jgi:hypothetical protein